MIYSIKNKDDLKNLEELNDLQSKAKEDRLIEKIVKQGFHYDVKDFFEPITDSIKNTSEDITKTIMETSNKNNKALENLYEKSFEIDG